MIDPRTRVYMFVLGMAVLAFMINLLRKRQMQERYAMLWLLAGVGLTLAPIFINQIDGFAYALGFAYPPALLLMLAMVGLLLIILQLSLTISKNSEHLKVLTQELGLMQNELDRLRAEMPRAAAAHPGLLPQMWSDHADSRE